MRWFWMLQHRWEPVSGKVRATSGDSSTFLVLLCTNQRRFHIYRRRFPGPLPDSVLHLALSQRRVLEGEELEEEEHRQIGETQRDVEKELFLFDPWAQLDPIPEGRLFFLFGRSAIDASCRMADPEVVRCRGALVILASPKPGSCPSLSLFPLMFRSHFISFSLCLPLPFPFPFLALSFFFSLSFSFSSFPSVLSIFLFFLLCCLPRVSLHYLRFSVD